MNYKCFSLFFVYLCFSTWVKGEEIQIFADDSYPPYSYFESGAQKGIYADIIRKVDEKLEQYEISIHSLPWKRALRKIDTGEIALVYPPYKRLKERPYMTYSVPMLQEELSIFCQRGLNLTKASKFPQDFKDLLIGKNLGFSSGDAVQQARESGLIRFLSTKGNKANLKKLVLNKLDCYVNDRLSILYELALLERQGLYDGKSIVESISLGVENAYLGVSKNLAQYPSVPEFVKAFNKQILLMQDNGEIKEIVNLYTRSLRAE